jgi:hypothetical protein
MINPFKSSFGFCCALLLPVLLFGQDSALVKNFKNPPAEYSLLPFWSWNGTLTADKLTWQMDQMQEKGIHGAFLHSRAGLDESETPYFSDGFWNAMDTTIKHAASIGFQTYLYDEDKWPSGSAGGRTVAANPLEFVKKVIVYSKMEVVGPQTIQLNLQKKPMSVFAGRISETGKYDFSSQVNVSNQASGEWKVPSGRWAIVSFAMLQDPEKQIDYLDSLAVAKFIDITHEEYFRRYGQYFGNTIPGIFFDEIYANGSNMAGNMFWTDDFLQQFKSMKGYDVSENLPLLIFDDPEKSAKIRFDYFDVVKQLYIRAWFKPYADWCARHSIWATGHTTEKLVHYKRQADYFSTMGQLQVPGADNEEYRYGYPRMIDWYNNKQISSIANLYNRKRVMSETMGGGGYTIPLEEYRYGISMLAVYGINLFIPHLFHYTTDTPETQADWPPSWFYTNPYWKYFKPLADFGSRISFMNSQGREVCDVAILYPLTDLWINGYPDQVDDTFYKQVQETLLENHINFNIIDPASLAHAEITDRQLKAGKGSYRILILPDIQAIRLDVLKQIKDFVNAGGVVVSLKSLPARSQQGREGDAMAANEMKQLFGIHPGELRPNEYHQWNKQQTEHYTAKSGSNGGAAYFSRFLNQLAEIINRTITPDLLVSSDNSQYLQFNHRQAENTHVFLLVNDRNLAQKYSISTRDMGRPSIWDPETGEIRPLINYRIKDKRMEMILDFQARESCYLVLDSAQPDTANALIASTDLVQSQISKNAKSLVVQGWGNPNQKHALTCIVNDRTIHKSWISDRPLAEIALSGTWHFQLAPRALDYKWQPTIAVDMLQLPVMKFQPERAADIDAKEKWSAPDFDDSTWKTIKVADAYNKKTGIQRYVSSWDAWWISYYDNSTHLPAIAGGDRTFSKEITFKSQPKTAQLAITADQSYELFINNKSVGSDNDWKTAESYDIAEFLKPGSNELRVKTAHSKGLLLQGFIVLKNGDRIAIRSDSTWQISVGQVNERPAFQLAAPPLGAWGEIANPLIKQAYPLVVWYRQQIPPGITALKKPAIKGNYALLINGAAVQIVKSADAVDLRKLMKKGSNNLALRVQATDATCGLIQPLELLCEKTDLPLTPWHDLGLDWYSGRALYTKKVQIPSAYLQQDTRLLLNLGQVHYFAEIWVNGKLVTYRPWPPFEADITEFVQPGENEISIVVANLLANQASWNILDANVSSREARWWHDGSLRREKEKLISGLLGPVRIIPLHKESIEIKFE